MSNFTVEAKLGDSTKKVEIKGRCVEGYWADESGNKVDKTFFGDTVFYYVRGKYFMSCFNVKVFLKIGGQEINLTEGRVVNMQKDGEDVCLVCIDVKDRWELGADLQNRREALLECRVSADSFVFVDDHCDTIKVMEFELQNDFIIAGPKLKKTPVLACRKFSQKVHAVVLHRTGSQTVLSALNSAKSSAAAHFYVAKNGDVYQKISLAQVAPHVGYIRVKPSEGQRPKKSSSETHIAEIKKEYPERYPYNEDSIGIEVVGMFLTREKDNGRKEDYYLAPTDIEQIKAVTRLVNFLTGHFSLNIDTDIYGHEIISSKCEGEGDAVYEVIKSFLL